MHGAVGSHSDPLAPWSSLTPCELPKGPPQALLHTGNPSHSLEQDIVPGTVIPGCLLKYWGEKPANVENCSGHAQFSPSPVSSNTFPADGHSRFTALDGPQEASAELLFLFLFLGEVLAWDTLLPFSQDLKPWLWKPDDSQLPGDFLMFLLFIIWKV